MSDIEKQIQHARPSLRLVSPLAYWDVLIMGFFNILLGISFLFGIDANRVSAPLLIVNDLFTYDFWGLVFLTLGFVKLFALMSNDWKLARSTLFFGVSIKAAWMVALIIRSFVSPGTVFFAVVWATIALLQMGAYIWFMPPASGEHYKQRKELENE